MNPYGTALKILALLGLGIWSLASSAFTPWGPFTATGPLTIKYNPALPAATCTLTVHGLANGGVAQLHAATIGGANPICSTVAVQGLPWGWQPTSATAVNFSGMSIRIGTVTCGTGATVLATSWSNAGNSLSASSQPLGGCTLQSLTLTTSPALTLP
ncbi:hypothetical protein [Pseudomonas tohonis]|uniref:hypothetical protein n=1 Tax=Pseudomonas tohonis TaxID=2725477 RepID=UPI0022EFEAC0|nr:hypothetical protein [Pseudomonas tohonis]